MAPQTRGPATSTTAPSSNVVTNGEPMVNRKKQKRRQKQAAKLAAEQLTSNTKSNPGPKQNGHYTQQSSSTKFQEQQEDDDQYESRDESLYSERDVNHPTLSSKSKKKKKKRAQSNQDDTAQIQPRGPSKDRIWNTSTAEERERIKEFWLSLEEAERRSLVKVEKEAVLKKMKEQQRNSCSCTICGRKRTAIEEELEVLYDAYYDELEQYANHQQIDGTIMPPPPSAYPSLPRPRPPHHHHHHHHHHHIPGPPPKGRIMEEFDDEDLADEDYSDEEDSEDGDYYDEDPRGPATEFFNFGNSLTVQGGILTVADDLLKNDGKKFIEMMEQLAERRMARERLHVGRYQQPPMGHPVHDHGPPLDDDEDYDDEEDEGEDYDSQDDYEDEEEMEAMSEEQRMEEGRRMFQIFAARMFEQRVLTAYREKVAKERQERLIEELNDEDAQKAQREAKKAKEAQKKKDKKKQQKAAKEEERLRKEAEKEAALAAAKAAEERKVEEQRMKREELRKKKEAEKKAQEDERLRKETEKQQRLREQQAEAERKQREQKDKERKRKEEVKKREKDVREVRAKKEREEKETRARAEYEIASQAKKEEPYASKPPVQPAVPTLTRKISAAPVVPTVPPGLHSSSSNSHASPLVQVATPAIPKAPSPVKPRQASLQGSHHSSPKSTTQNPSDSSATSAGSGLLLQQQQQQYQQPPPGITIPLSKPHHLPGPIPSSIPPPPGIPHNYPPMGSPPLGGAGFPSYNPAPGMPPRIPGPDMYGHQPMPPFRSFGPPGNFGVPPGIAIPRQMNPPPGRGSPIDGPPQPLPIGHYPTPHSRHPSGSYERSSFDLGAIARPNPIERPSSLPHQEENEVDELSKRLGSSALGDSMEDSPDMKPLDPRAPMPPGRSNRLGFGASPFPEMQPRMNNFSPNPNTWGPPQMPMAMPNQHGWVGSGPWPVGSSNFGPIGGGRISPGILRSLACRACRHLSAMNLPKGSGVPAGFHSLDSIIRQMEQIKGPGDGAVLESELVKVLEAEGTPQNGGGIFEIQIIDRIPYARHEFEGNFRSRVAGAPGEIGSPIPGNSIPFGRGYSGLNL